MRLVVQIASLPYILSYILDMLNFGYVNFVTGSCCCWVVSCSQFSIISMGFCWIVSCCSMMKMG
uniref:Uncharacterized protein n=1 Tax=Arundo donax TaxID=35708 RepID=A0A0A9HL52_ARUDO